MNLQGYVSRGVALLDDAAPDWYRKVDVKMLDLSSMHYCILGQVFGDYIDGKNELGIAAEEGSQYGFDAPIGYTYVGTERKWAKEIQSRVNGGDA